MSQQIAEAIGQLDLMISSAAAPGNGAVAAAAPANTAPAAATTAAGGSMRQQLAAAFQTAIDGAFPPMAGEPAVVVACNQPKFGDYQCNNAMALHGKMKGKASRPPSRLLQFALAGGAASTAAPGESRMDAPLGRLAQRLSLNLSRCRLRRLLPSYMRSQCQVHVQQPVKLLYSCLCEAPPACWTGAFGEWLLSRGSGPSPAPARPQPDAPKAPRMVAEAILAQLPDTGMVAETSLAGGGL